MAVDSSSDIIIGLSSVFTAVALAANYGGGEQQ